MKKGNFFTKSIKQKKKSHSSKKPSQYTCVFHCSKNENDCINSIDIFDDKVVFGTLMGDVFLCRVDKNNLYGSNNNFIESQTLLSLNRTNMENISDRSNIKDKLNNTDDNNIENNKDECACIKLKVSSKNDIDDINTNKNNLINMINNMRNKKNNDNSKSNDCSNYTNEDLSYEEYEDDNKYERKLINKNMNKNSNSVKNTTNSNKNKGYFLSFKEKELLQNKNLKNKIQFPQITKLIIRSKENIPCLEFEGNDIINISIGDLEVIRLENMDTFNINDNSSTYNYSKMRNYYTENDHIEFCENCTCMMSNSYYLIVFTQFGCYDSKIEISKTKYENKNMKNYVIVKGEIEMSNFTVPFDFDGDKFLFLDNISENERKICIYYTLSKKEKFTCIIKKNFGHISHMKLLPDNKIFLCRNKIQCEIYETNEEFSLIEKFEHFGQEVISSYVYLSGKKISEYGLMKFYTNNMIYEKNNSAKKNPNKIFNNTKTVNVGPFNEYKNKNKEESNGIYTHKNKHRSSIPSLDKSSRREINYTNENKAENKLRKKYNENKRDSNISNSIDVYQGKKFKKIFQMNNKIMGSGDITINNQELKKSRIEENLFYITTLDKNGNLNLYLNQKESTLFNLYDIKGIDINKNNFDFFSIGFPYYMAMNELYYVITTDHGLYVVSRDKNNEK